MHGPFLPIYGFGAITVLVTTIPVKNNLVLVFLFGMIGATILEYVTGAVMEKMFHVRYWDYSNQKLNLNGYICLTSSLAWGAFSVFMVRVLHCPIEAFVFMIPDSVAEIIAFVLTVGIAVDFTQSFNEAMDLKELLENLTESNEEVQRLKKRLDVVIAVVDNEYKELVQKASDGKQVIEDKLTNMKQKVVQIREDQKEKTEVKHLSREGHIRLNLQKNRTEKSNVLTNLSDRLNLYLDTVKTTVSKENREEEMEKLRIELEGVKDTIMKQMSKLHGRSDKVYTRALGLLRRNPDAVSKEYADALEEVQKLDQNQK